MICPHFLHRSISLLEFLPLLPLSPDLESELLCENLHLSPRVQVPLAKCFQGIVALCAPFVVTFGTLSRSSRAVVETGVCVHHRQTGGLAFDGRVQFSWIIRREQICDFVHTVEVSDSARDHLQGLHHRFFGWRTSSRLQLREVCEPLSQRQQQLRLLSARNGVGKPLAKRCARKGLCATISKSRSLTTGPRQGGVVTSCRRC